MKIPKYEENKIFYTNNILKWLKVIANEKDNILITPLTEMTDLLNFKNKNVLKDMIIEFANEVDGDLIDVLILQNIANKVNDKFDQKIIDLELSIDKIIKNLLEVNSEIEINEKLIEKYLTILNKYATKQIDIYISGFEFVPQNYSMLNINIVSSNIKGLISWSNLESLVILNYIEPFEVINKEKFLSWLELKTKTALSIKDLHKYFEGKIEFNSFLIERAFKNIN